MSGAQGRSISIQLNGSEYPVAWNLRAVEAVERNTRYRFPLPKATTDAEQIRLTAAIAFGAMAGAGVTDLSPRDVEAAFVGLTHDELLAVSETLKGVILSAARPAAAPKN
jgi:hypothetical protein